MVANLAEDREILDRASFKYNFEFNVYFNCSTRKVITNEAVDDHDTEWLRQCIKEDNRPNEWLFYSNSPTDETRRKEIVAKLVGAPSI